MSKDPGNILDRLAKLLNEFDEICVDMEAFPVDNRLLLDAIALAQAIDSLREAVRQAHPRIS